MSANTLSANQDGAPQAEAGPAWKRIRVWDLPTRIFHWALVLAVTTAVVTGEIGGSWMAIHGKAGLTIVGLVAFRLVWGWLGSTHARFVNFFPSPKKIRTYFRGQWDGVGHNPLGAISVFALLTLLALQGASGLFSNDDIAFAGPLNTLVDQQWSNRLAGYHQWLSYGLFALMGLHLLAIGFYLWFKKDNLVKPMVTGWKQVKDVKPREKSAAQGSLTGFLIALFIAFVVVLLANGAGLDDAPAAPAAPAATVAPSSAPAW